MKKIPRFIRRNKMTLMLIPSEGRSIKQIRFNLILVFSVLFILIVANILLLTNTISSKYIATVLGHTNQELTVTNQVISDKLNNLENIASIRSSQVETLRSQLYQSSHYLDHKLTEIEQSEVVLATLIDKFNIQTNSDIQMPISRSFSRNQSYESKEIQDPMIALDKDLDEYMLRTQYSESQRLIKESKSLSKEDEITIILEDKTDALQQISTKLENTLDFIDARPDAYPTYGNLTSPFGYRNDPITKLRKMHNGIDLQNRQGTPIYAAGSGIVTHAGLNSYYGYYIVVNHGYHYETVYAHCNELIAKEGQHVNKGDLIAKMGGTGRVTGVHLHFEIRYQGTPINPLTVLR